MIKYDQVLSSMLKYDQVCSSTFKYAQVLFWGGLPQYCHSLMGSQGIAVDTYPCILTFILIRILVRTHTYQYTLAGHRHRLIRILVQQRDVEELGGPWL